MESDNGFLPQHRALMRRGLRWFYIGFIALTVLSAVFLWGGHGDEAFPVAVLVLVVSMIIVSLQGGEDFLTDERTAPFVSTAARWRAGAAMIVFIISSIIGMAGITGVRVLQLLERWTPALHEVAVIVVTAALCVAFCASLVFALERWRVRHAALLA